MNGISFNTENETFHTIKKNLKEIVRNIKKPEASRVGPANIYRL
jgi:hypothetical protein